MTANTTRRKSYAARTGIYVSHRRSKRPAQWSECTPKLARHIHTDSRYMTDSGTVSMGLGSRFKQHETVNHSRDEYVRGDVYTNTVEGYFSILKRGIYGVYKHVSEAHLQRYLVEFDFRYSHRMKLGIDDAARTDLALQGAWGRRLTYRTIGGDRPAAPAS